MYKKMEGCLLSELGSIELDTCRIDKQIYGITDELFTAEPYLSTPALESNSLR